MQDFWVQVSMHPELLLRGPVLGCLQGPLIPAERSSPSPRC